jgi:AcrR family transcriptional regulator
MRVTAETKIATRQRILDSAQRLFAQQGFETTTTRDIARSAKIAVGTLFNYFPTKESIVLHLVSEAHAKATEAFLQTASDAEPASSLEEELFAHVAVGLRKLTTYRKYLPVVLEISLSPLTDAGNGETPSLRAAHLETVGDVVARRGHHDAFSPVAIQLYWTLYTGLLTFWAVDSSPQQEDTLALLDQSLAMFVGWLTGEADRTAPQTDNGE